MSSNVNSTPLNRSSTVVDTSEESGRFSNDPFHNVSQSLVDRRSDLRYLESEGFDPSRFSDVQIWDEIVRTRFSNDPTVSIGRDARFLDIPFEADARDSFVAMPYQSTSPSLVEQDDTGHSHHHAELELNELLPAPDLPPPMFVRALYDYDEHDDNCLSFRQGDIIQVITQLESGWWDGVINDVRGWFPSNYTHTILLDEWSDTVTLREGEGGDAGAGVLWTAPRGV